MNLPKVLDVPTSLSTFFLLIVLYTLYHFHGILRSSNLSNKQANTAMLMINLWVIVQSILAMFYFYTTDIKSVPPRFIFLLGPFFLVTIWIFLNKKGKSFIDSMSLEQMTWLSTIRIPVEFCLYWLFINNVVPELMTFSGRNFDIIAGITAPIIAYFGFRQKKLGKSILLGWNIVCLGLLLFIVVNAILAAPMFFQQFAFEQPNVAVFYFPFILLPGIVVPIIIFGHIVSIRRLIMNKV